MRRGTAEADEQKKDRDYQKAINLAFAELGIGWHFNAACKGRDCSRSRSAAPGMVP
jgi:hypothetical protein